MTHSLLAIRYLFLELCFSFWHTLAGITVRLSEKATDQMEDIMKEQDVITEKMVDILRYRQLDKLVDTGYTVFP